MNIRYTWKNISIPVILTMISGSALADGRHWGGHEGGWGRGGFYGGVVVGPPVYYPPPVVYMRPPVVYAAPPVVYAPPMVYAAPPMVYAPATPGLSIGVNIPLH